MKRGKHCSIFFFLKWKANSSHGTAAFLIYPENLSILQFPRNELSSKNHHSHKLEWLKQPAVWQSPINPSTHNIFKATCCKTGPQSMLHSFGHLACCRLLYCVQFSGIVVFIFCATLNDYDLFLQIAAFISESMQGCGGQIVYPPNYLKEVYK